MDEDCSKPLAGVGSLDAGLLPAYRPTRRGGGSSAAWREGGLFFLLGGGEPVNAAIIGEREAVRAKARDERRVAGTGPCSVRHRPRH